tara:strand:+ start:1369 stop:1875 length:507 start_codon:yes stop_codon:yes gene_type:complete
MASTYTPLATTTLGGNTASYTFGSISSAYTDLILIARIQQVTDGEDVAIQFNSDTGTNYSRTYLCGDGSTAHSGRSTSSTSIICDHHATPPTTNAFSTNIIHIQNYSNTNTNKSILARSGSSGTLAATVAVSGLWRSNTAVNSVTIFCTNGSNMKANTTLSLYGIKEK